MGELLPDRNVGVQTAMTCAQALPGMLKGFETPH